MTIEDKRIEEIKYASKDYVNYLLDKQEYHNENYTEYDIQQAFEKGAQWADEHPKNMWHDASDGPKPGKQVLTIDFEGEAASGTFAKSVNGIFIFDLDDFVLDCDLVARWAYISDLLPKTK